VYRFLATGEEPGGRYALWEAIVPPAGWRWLARLSALIAATVLVLVWKAGISRART
jgi:hypothetical protein